MMKKAVINGRMLDIVPIKEAIESTNESNNNIAIEAIQILFFCIISSLFFIILAFFKKNIPTILFLW